MTRVQLISAAAAVFVGGCLVGQAVADQPHMKNALDSLRSARSELVAATPNKGGHRERALALIDQATAEVRAGITFAATH